MSHGWLRGLTCESRLAQSPALWVKTGSEAWLVRHGWLRAWLVSQGWLAFGNCLLEIRKVSSYCCLPLKTITRYGQATQFTLRQTRLTSLTTLQSTMCGRHTIEPSNEHTYQATWLVRWHGSITQTTQTICITFVQRRHNVFHVGPILHKCYTNVSRLLSGRCTPTSQPECVWESVISFLSKVNRSRNIDRYSIFLSMVDFLS